MLRLQPDVRGRLYKGSCCAAGRAFRGPGVVEGGEVVVDPDSRGVAQPVVDVVAFPQVAIAGGPEVSLNGWP